MSMCSWALTPASSRAEGWGRGGPRIRENKPAELLGGSGGFRAAGAPTPAGARAERQIAGLGIEPAGRAAAGPASRAEA